MTSSRPLRFRATPPASVLWTMSGDTTLTATGVPNRAAAAAASSGLPARTAGTTGTPARSSRLRASASDQVPALAGRLRELAGPGHAGVSAAGDTGPGGDTEAGGCAMAAQAADQSAIRAT